MERHSDAQHAEQAVCNGDEYYPRRGACLIGKVPVEETVRPMLGYLGLLLVCLLVIAFVPGISTFLPHLMGY